MTIEAQLYQDGACVEDWTADGTYSAGDVIQMKGGRAGVLTQDCVSGQVIGVYVSGTFTVQKTTSMVLLQGGRVYWDYSANLAHYKKVNDRDFLMGSAAEDATSAATTVKVQLNVNPVYDLDINRDPCLSVTAGTAAAGGFGYPVRLGGANILELTATNEAQKVDLMSADGFATGANAIVEFAFRVISDGAGSAVDVSLGVANGTHATDADSITESVFVHLDANNTNINAESDDGTTEVAATDTTLDYTEGSAIASRVEVWMDMRDPADVQIYVNGALVLGSTVFGVGAAAGPWFLLAHVEKTSSTDTYKLAVDWMRARYAQV